MTPKVRSFASGAAAAALAGALALAAAPAHAQPVPLNERSCALLVLDLGLDAVMLVRDLDGDGRAEGVGEATVFYGAGSASGLTIETAFSLLQLADGSVLVGDGTLDAVLRLQDLNGDYDAMDEGESREYFGATLVNPPLTLPTPNGLAVDEQGWVYIASAGTSGVPSQIYRVRDNNGNGSAIDDGEYALFLDTSAAIAPTQSVIFSVTALDGAVYYVDTRSTLADAVMRTVNGAAPTVFVAETEFGVPVTNTVFTDGTSLYTHETTNTAGTQKIYRLRDLNGSFSIDAQEEAVEVWSELGIPAEAGVQMTNSFSANVGRRGLAAVVSNGNDVQDNVFLLKDLNFDGDFLDAGETIVFATAQGTAFPESPRSLLFFKPRCPADFNIGGGVSVQDIYDFLAAWNAVDPCADFNGVGGVSVQDIYDFLSAWSAPCP